jgi:hypothetical protein
MGVFQKGQVNNPHGRPVIPEELKAKLKDGFTEVIQFWFDTLRNDTERWDYRNKAAENIANYGYGKPKESVEVEHISEAVESHEETLRKIDELLARREAAKATGKG